MNTYESVDFWNRLLHLLQFSDDKRFLENPANVFSRDVKGRVYDKMDFDEFDPIRCRVEKQASLYQNKRMASAYVIFLRAFQQLTLSDAEFRKLSDILSSASERTQEFESTDYTHY